MAANTAIYRRPMLHIIYQMTSKWAQERHIWRKRHMSHWLLTSWYSVTVHLNASIALKLTRDMAILRMIVRHLHIWCVNHCLGRNLRLIWHTLVFPDGVLPSTLHLRKVGTSDLRNFEHVYTYRITKLGTSRYQFLLQNVTLRTLGGI